jgi:DNA-directed RNA polymerase specialized sigma24 family protein
MNNIYRSTAASTLDTFLADNEWFARLAAALVTQDGEIDRPALPWSPVATAGDAVERTELRLTLLHAVLALDEPYRGILALRFLEGRGIADIARVTSSDSIAVQVRITEGIRRLRATISM